MRTITSKNNVPIRLTEERWLHITEEHTELAGLYFEVLEAIHAPQAIYLGNNKELLAIRNMQNKKYLVVVYKELNVDDGFVITSFITTKIRQIIKRIKIWPIGAD